MLKKLVGLYTIAIRTYSTTSIVIGGVSEGHHHGTRIIECPGQSLLDPKGLLDLKMKPSINQCHGDSLSKALMEGYVVDERPSSSDVVACRNTYNVCNRSPFRNVCECYDVRHIGFGSLEYRWASYSKESPMTSELDDAWAHQDADVRQTPSIVGRRKSRILSMTSGDRQIS